MTEKYNPYYLSNPTIYLIKIIIFLILIGLIGSILFIQLLSAFWANPFINGLILFVLFIGIMLSFRQVLRLIPEVNWVNSLQNGESDRIIKPPILLAPIDGIMRERLGEAIITPASMRSILDSVGMRLEEAKETSRYLTGLLVFLGLLGTFYGLLQTVGSVSEVIQGLDVGEGDSINSFSTLKEGLQAPLSGMGTAFSSSLFGLTGSLILGFLDLQTGQAQNAFYTELEDWMASMTELDHPVTAMQATGLGVSGDEMQAMLEQLGSTMKSTDSSQNAIRAMAELAHGIDGLVKHIRAEQADLRKFIHEQGKTNEKLRELIVAVLSDENNGKDK